MRRASAAAARAERAGMAGRSYAPLDRAREIGTVQHSARGPSDGASGLPSPDGARAEVDTHAVLGESVP